MQSSMWGPVSSTVCRNLNRLSFHVPTPPNSGERYQKRKVLIIHCHPLEDSLSASLANAVVRGLDVGGHQSRLRHLYKFGDGDDCYNRDSFPAELTLSERSGYRNPDVVEKRRHGDPAGLSHLAVEVREAVEDLRWCDSIVFVFPIWWFNFPAVLKGYFDRVMLPGVATLIPGASDTKGKALGSTGLVGLLTNINKIGVVTTSGSSWAVNMYAGRGPSHFISRGFRVLCAPDCQMTWHQLYEVSSKTDAERQRFLSEVEQAYAVF
jgi:NAD(P)H dehydrogenase (quinone)